VGKEIVETQSRQLKQRSGAQSQPCEKKKEKQLQEASAQTMNQ
jgi:hypothetical protein